MGILHRSLYMSVRIRSSRLSSRNVRVICPMPLKRSSSVNDTSVIRFVFPKGRSAVDVHRRTSNVYGNDIMDDDCTR